MFIESFWLDLVMRVTVLAPLTILWVIILVRLIGLRTFSKMTSFDFVITLATGSLTASAVSAKDWESFFQAVLAASALCGVQYFLARIRFRFPKVERELGNQALLLFSRGRFYQDAMRAARMTEADLYGKMREANALQVEEVQAIVLEETGDVTVLHGKGPPDERIIEGVKERV